MTQEVTDTDARLRNLLISNVEDSISNKMNQKITQTVSDFKIQLGEVIKFYPYLSKAEVRLTENNQKVICILPHHFMGDMLDLFVPTGDEGFCDTLREPCIFPRSSLHCAVLPIKNVSEYFLIAYYLPDELIGFSMPKNGNFRLACVTGTNECFLEFGYDGLNIVSNKSIKHEVGEFEGNLERISYVQSDDVYSKTEIDEFISQTGLSEEYYTKTEIDEKISNIGESNSSDINLEDVNGLQSALNNKADISDLASKADWNDVLVDIQLVPKSKDNTGAINLIYGGDLND